MKILFISSEVVPFAKTGGLADVAGALPKAIKDIGHDIRILMPRYGCVTENESEVPVYFFEDEHFSKRDTLYVKDGKDYSDNCEAFLAFCRSVEGFLQRIDWQPDIIHCNDWQTALVCFFVQELRKNNPSFKRCATVFSIHNLAYQGNFPEEKFSSAGLPKTLEFYNQLSFIKAGILYADVINAVSETYAEEIQTKEYGYGFDKELKKRSKDVYGILNGLDYSIWNPAKDPLIKKRYSPGTLSLRGENKLELQKRFGLPQNKDVPILGLVSRLADQKGFDILEEVLEDVLNQGCQFVLLGTGEKKYHQFFERLKNKHPQQVGLELGFDDTMAHLIYAGSDVFLMPSQYEPCGLGQLISFKYGAIPLVRETGGLADTVDENNGFVFADYTGKALLSAVKKALEVFKNKSAWTKMQQKVMAYDYSWDASAKKYLSLYMKALAKIGIEPA